MPINFSDDQLKVIRSRDENLLVSAAAGSGKTAVLVERIIERVLDPVKPIDIDRVLVVTYTNAAAKEMKERIGAALNARLLTEPENKHLQKQVQLIHNSYITTIDSFCLNVIRKYFSVIGLDPATADNIVDDSLKKQMLEEAFTDFFQRNLSPYGRRDLPVGFVGSIAFHFAEQLSRVAQREGYTLGEIVKDPIERLKS